MSLLRVWIVGLEFQLRIMPMQTVATALSLSRPSEGRVILQSHVRAEPLSLQFVELQGFI